MELSEFRNKIKKLISQVYKEKSISDDKSLAYDELVKFPELKKVIIDLLTVDFDKFMESVDWIAPRPTTFRINLLNSQNFLIIFTPRSWIAQVEGKKYYLLNLDEEEQAAKSISRILQYGNNLSKDEENKIDLKNKKEKPSEEPSPEESKNTEDEFNI